MLFKGFLHIAIYPSFFTSSQQSRAVRSSISTHHFVNKQWFQDRAKYNHTPLEVQNIGHICTYHCPFSKSVPRNNIKFSKPNKTGSHDLQFLSIQLLNPEHERIPQSGCQFYQAMQCEVAKSCHFTFTFSWHHIVGSGKYERSMSGAINEVWCFAVRYIYGLLKNLYYLISTNTNYRFHRLHSMYDMELMNGFLCFCCNFKFVLK